MKRVMLSRQYISSAKLQFLFKNGFVIVCFYTLLNNTLPLETLNGRIPEEKWGNRLAVSLIICNFAHSYEKDDNNIIDRPSCYSGMGGTDVYH
jgi:hypothetical protein